MDDTIRTLTESLNKIEKILEYFKTHYQLEIPPDNWTHRILEILQKSKHIHSSIIDLQDLQKHLDDFSEQHGEEYIYGIALLSELDSIYDYLDFQNQDKSILKKKLAKIFDAPLLKKDETKENNESRNTLFELRLCAHLKKHFGHNPKLNVPNPDIIVPIHENGTLQRTYFIECKRSFSSDENTLKDRVVEAKSTLIKHLTADNTFGIIALCVGRPLIQDWQTWRVEAKPWEKTEQLAMRKLEASMMPFAQTFHEKINYLLDNPKIVAILYEFQGVAVEKKVMPLNFQLFKKVSENAYLDKDFPERKVYIPNDQETISILAPPERDAFKRILVPAHLMHRY